ncbi:PAS domain-containing hybrid sensor histidine kinase/response regulator [Methylovirgula sp. HY1]|uniref:PAS domain-containing hybrid sensor histidine kinase/response regulator n=1 Tax=Methylovirgula sp. HY1 TaxID=2822761 RepID=UPI001C5B110F|nr:PAS domain-containing hybrid sensor histidine kinase/response regulator [Methylovirgula sp. HY1]QXX75338.1 Non-motile and phage-resistance protein [Methylovirgula sp. HY1]
MIPGWLAILTTLAYLVGLFAVARFGDTSGRRFVGARARSAIYVLSLGVYCTSWTFFGSVGIATNHGVEFLAIYIGPIIVFGLFYPFLLRIVRIAKAQNITSIADFVAARYGKSAAVAALVASIAVIGVVPYVALQLKAVSASLTTVLGTTDGKALTTVLGPGTLSALVAAVLAGFAIAFGTRHIDATEHQDGLMLAIATESIIKLVAFLCVGIYVTWGMFDGLGDLSHRVATSPELSARIATTPDLATTFVMTLLAGMAIIFLPRQFHVAIVENRKEADIRKAAWLFPLYLVAINLFVVPLAIAGLVTFSHGMIDRDMTVLALPIAAKAGPIVLITLVGGLSAATAMAVLGSVAVAIMVSNDLAMPLLLRLPKMRRSIEASDIGAVVLAVRRLAIVALMTLSYLYFRHASDVGLAAIGLLSFACVAQIAPAFFGGLFWHRANARGAIAGLTTGVLFWAYTMLLPSLDQAFHSLSNLVSHGPLGVALLKPTALFGTAMDPLVHGVVFSLGANILAFIGFSLTRQAKPMERLQANIFIGAAPTLMAQSFRPSRARVTLEEIEAAVARCLGAERTHRAFAQFLAGRGIDLLPSAEADIHLLRFAEHLMASSIGSASSRLVLSLLFARHDISRDATLEFVDEISTEIQHNRDILQHAIDVARQGISVFDRDLRLVCWNREFRDLFDLPSDLLRTGTALDEIIRFNAERGIYGPGRSDEHLAARLEILVRGGEPLRIGLSSGRIVEVRSAPTPDGGLVVTYIDATAQAESEQELEFANEVLERRVQERTEELVELNAALQHAKAEAEEANLSKTRFLAAASHDLLQPLNAARLYATSLANKMQETSIDEMRLARHVDASLEAVQEILTTLLDISRLDAKAMQAEITQFRIDDILNQLRLEFGPLAQEKGLRLSFVPCSLTVRSDRRLLRRLVQNLVSNAIKYTLEGRILIGVRQRGSALHLQVYDTGIGIPQDKQREIFREFTRLAPAIKTARGAGLGLSIVERLSRVLNHPVSLQSTLGKGSVFSVAITRGNMAAQAQAPNAAPQLIAHGRLDGMFIAVIDNAPDVLHGMRLLLEGWGCQCVAGADLAELLAKQEECGHVPEALIADYHLDEGNGISAISGLRDRFGAHLPAILVTADRSSDLRDRAAKHDIRVLTKPLKPAALRALLAQWRILEGTLL